MKFILPCPQIKLHINIQNTAENCTTSCTSKYPTCCTIKILKN